MSGDHLNSSDASELMDMSSKYMHIFDPVKDIAESWSINLSDDLETYINDLQDLVNRLGPEGAAKIDFSQAALMIQGSISIFTKKVDSLHQQILASVNAFNKGNLRGLNAILGPGSSVSGPGRRGRVADPLYDDMEPTLRPLGETLLSSLDRGVGASLIDEVLTSTQEAEVYRLRDQLLAVRQSLTLLSSDSVSLIPTTTTPSLGFKVSNLITDDLTGFLMFEDIDRALAAQSLEQAIEAARTIRKALAQAQKDALVAAHSRARTGVVSARPSLLFGSPDTLFRPRPSVLPTNEESGVSTSGPTAVAFPDLSALGEGVGSNAKPETSTKVEGEGQTQGGSVPAFPTTSFPTVKDEEDAEKNEKAKTLAAIADAMALTMGRSEGIPLESTSSSSALSSSTAVDLVALDAVAAASLRWQQEKASSSRSYKHMFDRLDAFDATSGGLPSRQYSRGRAFVKPRRVFLQGVDPTFPPDYVTGPEETASETSGTYVHREILSPDDILESLVEAGSTDLFNSSAPSAAMVAGGAAGALSGLTLRRGGRAGLVSENTGSILGQGGLTAAQVLPSNWATVPFEDEFAGEFVEALAVRRGLLALIRKSAREKVASLRAEEAEARTEESQMLPEPQSLLRKQLELSQALRTGTGIGTTAGTADDGDDEVIFSLGLGTNGGPDGRPISFDDNSGSRGLSLAHAGSSIESLARIAVKSALDGTLPGTIPDVGLENADLYQHQGDETGIGAGTDDKPLEDELDAFAPLTLTPELSKLEQSYEELSQQLMQGFLRTAKLYVAESNLSRRVREWQTQMEPLLEEQQSRGPFDIHKYGVGVIETIKAAPEDVRTLTHPEVPVAALERSRALAKKREAAGQSRHDFVDPEQEVITLDLAHAMAGKPAHEVCRIFLATLQLANSGNVEIAVDKDAPLNPNTPDKPSILDPVVAHKDPERDRRRKEIVFAKQQVAGTDANMNTKTQGSSVTTHPPVISGLTLPSAMLNAICVKSSSAGLIPTDRIRLKLLSERFRYMEEISGLGVEAADGSDRTGTGNEGDMHDILQNLPPSRQRLELEARAARKRGGKIGTKSSRRNRKNTTASASNEVEDELDDSFVVSDGDDEAMQPQSKRKIARNRGERMTQNKDQQTSVLLTKTQKVRRNKQKEDPSESDISDALTEDNSETELNFNSDKNNSTGEEIEDENKFKKGKSGRELKKRSQRKSTRDKILNLNDLNDDDEEEIRSRKPNHRKRPLADSDSD